MSVSVIIPVKNGAHTLPQVLAAIPLEWEVLVVDDGSSDGTTPLVQLPRILLRNPGRGPAAARNYGAECATHALLIFLDADVVPQPGALQGLVAHLQRVEAVFGAYHPRGSESEPAVSRFRNLLHSFVHHANAGPAQSFWAGMGAVRREALVAAGGFDERLFPTVSIEDVEFGFRLARSGGRILLDPSLQGVHLKRWSLAGMVSTDIFCRALPWTRLGMQGKVPLDGLNTSLRHRLALLCLLLSFWQPAFFILYALLQLPFLGFVARHAGPLMASASLGLLAIHHLCCLVGAGLGVLSELQATSNT